MKFDVILEGFLKLAQEYSLEAAVFVGILVTHYLLIVWLIKLIIKSKDDEIERLVDSRNELQKVIVRRLSSGGKRR